MEENSFTVGSMVELIDCPGWLHDYGINLGDAGEVISSDDVKFENSRFPNTGIGIYTWRLERVTIISESFEIE